MKRWKKSTSLWVAVFGLVIASSSASITPTIHPFTPNSTLTPTTPTTSLPAPSPSPSSSHTPSSSPSHSSSSTPTLSPSPSVSPSPTPLLYTVSDFKTNQTCIRMQADMLLTLNYTLEDGSQVRTSFQFLNTSGMTSKVDKNRSHCTEGQDGTTANMSILWTTPSNVTQNVTFNFLRGRDTWELSAVRVLINVTSADFPNVNASNFTVLNLSSTNKDGVFVNEYQRSYKCPNASVSLNNTSGSVLTDAILELMTWQIQAFEFREENTFGNARECPKYTNEDIKLPIIVASVLGVLLAAVVVVYILSRLRKRRLVSYEALN